MPVVWLGSSDGDPGLSDALASEVSRLEVPPDVEVVVGSWDVQGGRLLDVVATMDRLRSPGGCPWDAEQTHESLAPVPRRGGPRGARTPSRAATARHLAEELGDVLLQVVFHARVAEEAPERTRSTSTPSPGCSSTSWCAATRTSSPTATPRTPAEVEQAWERIKAQEKAAGADGGGRLRGRPAARHPRRPARRPRRREGARPGAPPRAHPSPDAVARLERARAALASAEADVRAALADLAASVDAPDALDAPDGLTAPSRVRDTLMAGPIGQRVVDSRRIRRGPLLCKCKVA